MGGRLRDIYPSYYGGFLCVCWSPDGKYVLTGGQDDLVSIWSLAERRLVARCPGHHSWVTSVAFDPWICDDRNYRFGSVGEDRRLLLWDFNVGMLHRPKVVGHKRRRAFDERVHTLIHKKVFCSTAWEHFVISSNYTKPDRESSNLAIPFQLEFDCRQL